jgi:crotonobetainyl-CoA:carnitine CoA-transferase CaiB-like acyl-CoA transferase
MGAKVIKIEHPTYPDRARSLGSFYEDLNTGKEVLCLDLLAPQDRDVFEEWVGKADGLIEGFRPATKAKLKLDEASLHKINPKLCIASIVGYPEDGPFADRAGHDANFAATTGLLSLFKDLPGLPIGDLLVAYEGALRLVAAMDEVGRKKLPKGRRVVVSISEALLQAQSGLIREFKDNGAIPTHGETLFSGRYPCYRLYSTADGRKVTVAAIEPKFWHKLCEILNLRELDREAFAIGEHGADVAASVQEALSKRPWKDWAPIFEVANCCVEPVLTYPEVFGQNKLPAHLERRKD